MRFYYSHNYVFPLPPEHPFPIQKYSEVANQLLDCGLVGAERLCDPGLVSEEDLLLVHEPEYISKFKSGTLDAQVLRKIGFPWSAEFVRRSHAAVAGTLAASLSAIADGISFNLAGGTHHAFPDRGEGYCVFNDVAIAVRKMKKRAAIIDLDAHQGNGTNFILGGDPQVYTFSMHVGTNFPSKKFPGSEDIGLGRGVTGDIYLTILKERLPALLAAFAPQLVFYVAGVDVHERDRFGQMALTTSEVAERDAYTINTVLARGLPLVIVMGGGYNKERAQTAALHLQTAKIALLGARQYC